MRDEIVAQIAWSLWADAFVTHMEDPDSGETERVNPGPGGSWDPLVPMPVPDEANEVARKLAASVERLNGATLDVIFTRLSDGMDGDEDTLVGRFAHDLAFQALGHGIGLSDDFDDGDSVKVPNVEVHAYRGDDGKLYLDSCGGVDERFV